MARVGRPHRARAAPRRLRGDAGRDHARRALPAGLRATLVGDCGDSVYPGGAGDPGRSTWPQSDDSGDSLAAPRRRGTGYRSRGRALRDGPGLRDCATRHRARRARAAAYASLLRRLGSDPAIALASLANPGALTGLGMVDFAWSTFSVCSPGLRNVPLKGCRVSYYAVSPDSFRAMGLHLAAGRTFRDSDGWTAPRVALISRSLAFPLRPREAVGRTLTVAHQPAAYTVLGVVDDLEPTGVGGGLMPEARGLSQRAPAPCRAGGADGAVDRGGSEQRCRRSRDRRRLRS